MSFHIQTGEFLHCNNNWFTISSVGVGHDGQTTVKVFHSMYDSFQSSNSLPSLHFRRFDSYKSKSWMFKNKYVVQGYAIYYI